MSLLRKIRRRHKAFVLRRSAQIHGDKVASIFPVDDGDDGDNADFQMDSLQQPDEQNGDISVSASHEPHQMPISTEDVSVQTDNAAQSSILIPAVSGFDMGRGVQMVGKESRFWFRTAKTAAFLVVTVGAFSVGKLAAMGLVLTVALACKLFVRDHIHNRESFVFAETEQSSRSLESKPSNTGMLRRDSEAPVKDESSGNRQMTIQAHDEEASDVRSNGDNLLAQRKKLTRLNCIKIPSSASPFVEAMEDSPSSSAKVSPQTWFRNAVNCTPTGKGAVASSAEMCKKGKFKSKALLRHLRRKGEPQSAPSSPLSSSQEGSSSFWVASDGSDTERSAHPRAPVHRRSKFRPASPVGKDASIRLHNQQTLQTLAGRKGERTLLAREAMVMDAPNAGIQKYAIETAAVTLAGRATLMTEVHSPSSPAEEKMQSAVMPATSTSRDATMQADMYFPLASTHEQSWKRRVKDQSSRRPVTLVSQEGSASKAVASINQNSRPVVVRKGGHKRRRGVGTLWTIAGFMIMLTGLCVGRMMAVTSLVCYWYALSFKYRKASETRR